MRRGNRRSWCNKRTRRRRNRRQRSWSYILYTKKERNEKATAGKEAKKKRNKKGKTRNKKEKREAHSHFPFILLFAEVFSRFCSPSFLVTSFRCCFRLFCLLLLLFLWSQDSFLSPFYAEDLGVLFTFFFPSPSQLLVHCHYTSDLHGSFLVLFFSLFIMSSRLNLVSRS